MAENLIYGKTVLDFGAKGDGKSDDTEAFIKAFSSTESLICIPFGHYTVKEELNLKSGVKVVCHPRAVIDFEGITIEEKAFKTIISGGIWNCTHKDNCAFDLTDSVFCRVENAVITSYDCCIGVCGGKNLYLENLELKSSKQGSCLVFGGDVSFIKLNNVKFADGEKALELASGCYAFSFDTNNIVFDGCEYGFFAKNFILANSYICDISGYTSQNSIHFEGGEIKDTIIKNISVYDGYIYSEGTKFFSLDILEFRRIAVREANAGKYSFVAAKCPDCTLICDGIPLDAVILSKKSVPDVKITAAKLASVSPSVYNYTAELPLDREHTYIIPCGGFESINLFSEKD